MYLHLLALMNKTFQIAFETTPLQPGHNWIVPICGRTLPGGRMHPHIHLNYFQQYGGGFGFYFTLEEGAR